jgi:hypothetical protein
MMFTFKVKQVTRLAPLIKQILNDHSLDDQSKSLLIKEAIVFLKSLLHSHAVPLADQIYNQETRSAMINIYFMIADSLMQTSIKQDIYTLISFAVMASVFVPEIKDNELTVKRALASQLSHMNSS